LDAAGNEIYREKGEITVTIEEILRWNYRERGVSELSEGKYTAVLETLYNVDVFDEFRVEFEIGKERRGITGSVVNFIGNKLNLWVVGGFVFGVLIIWFIWLLIRKQKKHREKKQRKKVKVRKKSLFTKKGTIIKITDKKSRGKVK